MTRSEEGLLFDYCTDNLLSLLTLSDGPFGLIDLVEIFKTPDLSEEQATELALDALITAIKRSMVALAPL